MTDTANTRTSESLLLRMQHADPETREQAWREFRDRYEALVFRWAMRHCHGHFADAKDLAQDVLHQLWETFSKGWRYDRHGSFRKWLKKVTRNAAITAFRRRRSRPDAERGVGGSANVQRLEHLADTKAADDLVARTEAEHEREVLARAEAEVKAVVNPKHWNVYELRQDGRPFKEIASALGIKGGSAKVVYGRVKGQVLLEARRLNHEILGDNGGTDDTPLG